MSSVSGPEFSPSGGSDSRDEAQRRPAQASTSANDAFAAMFAQTDGDHASAQMPDGRRLQHRRCRLHQHRQSIFSDMSALGQALAAATLPPPSWPSSRCRAISRTPSRPPAPPRATTTIITTRARPPRTACTPPPPRRCPAAQTADHQPRTWAPARAGLTDVIPDLRPPASFRWRASRPRAVPPPPAPGAAGGPRGTRRPTLA